MSKKDSIIKRFFRSAAGVLMARVLAFVSVFGFNAVLARALAPEDFGLFILLFSLAGLASLIGSAGMNRALVKILAAMDSTTDRKDVRQIIDIGFYTGLIGGIVVGLIGGVLAWLFLPETSSLAVTQRWVVPVLFAVIVSLRTIHLVMAETARGFHEKIWSNLFGGPAGGPLPHTVFLLLLLVAWFGYGLSTLPVTLILYLVSFAITSPPLLARVYTLKLTRQFEEEEAENAKGWRNESLLLLALPLMLTQSFGLTMSQADVWLAGALAVPASLAIYCSAQRMLAFLTIPLQIAGTGIVNFIPELVATKQTEKLQRLVGFSATLAGVPGMLIGICFLMFPETILTIAFGEYYAQGANLLRILAIGQLICIFTGPCEIVLMMAGHQNKTLIVNAIAAVAIFTAGPLGIIYFGMTGLAVALSVITSAQNLVNWILAKRLLGISTNVGAVEQDVWTGSFRKVHSLLAR